STVGVRLDGRARTGGGMGNPRRGVALAHKVGDRHQEWRLLGELRWCLARTGQWDEALAAAHEIPDDHLDWGLSAANAIVDIAAARGDTGEARRVLGIMSRFEESADLQERSAYAALNATVLRA